MRRNNPLTLILAFCWLVFGGVCAANATCTLPYQLTNGQTADATQVMANLNALTTCLANAAPGGSTNAVQFNNGSGTFGGAGPLTNGQLIIGSAGNAPQAQNLTAGTGITITNSAGGITIATSGGSGGGVDWLYFSAVVQPTASNFTLRTSTTAPAGAALSATSRGMLLSSTSVANSTAMMADLALPAGHWQATMLYVYSGPINSYNMPCIAVRDTVNNKSVQFGIGGSNGGWRFDYQKLSGGIGLNTYSGDTADGDVGLPTPAGPIWSRLTYDGTNLIWAFSRDGEHFVTAYTVSATNYVTNLSTIGPAVTFAQPGNTSWPAFMHVLSWSLVSI
jgi:hypothetical protein